MSETRYENRTIHITSNNNRVATFNPKRNARLRSSIISSISDGLNLIVMGGTVKEVAVSPVISSVMYAPTSHSGMIIVERYWSGARDIDMKMPRFTASQHMLHASIRRTISRSLLPNSNVFLKTRQAPLVAHSLRYSYCFVYQNRYVFR